MTRDEIIAREQADMELDARTEKQLKQCLECYYCARKNGNMQQYCDFVSWEGKLRDRGEGPGKCGSFRPRKKLTKRERLDRALMAINRSEATSVDKRFKSENS